MKPGIFSLLFLLLFVSCSTPRPVQVMHVRQMEALAGQEGFYYALPRTVLNIDVTVTKTEKVPGPFAEYAGKYLGLTDVIRDKSVNYDLSDIKISSYAEPDPTQFYFVKYDPEAFEDKPFYISFTESGLIKSVNTYFDSESYKLALEEQNEYGYQESEATFDYFIDTNLKEKIDTIVQMVIKDTVIVERQIFQSSWVEKGKETRAKEVADFILKLRNQKMDLISGFQEIQYQKETIEYMHKEINKVESSYLDLFTGLTSTSKIKYRFTYLPDKSAVGRHRQIFRFCNEEGIFPVSRRDKGSLVSLELQRDETTRQPEVFIRRNTDPKIKEYGFYYRIPEHAKVTIKQGDTIKSDARLLITQFGTIASLPSDNLKIEFYPNTGFIKSVGKIQK